MTELERAIRWLESEEQRVSQAMKTDSIPKEFIFARAIHIKNCRVLLDALRWVPVEDSLPIDGLRVLVCMNRDVLPGVYYSPTKTWYFGMDNYPMGSVTHWRKLPEAPKEG